MKKAKLFTLIAALTLSLSATSCAMPNILYTTVEGHQHTLVHYYNATSHWDECTECGERINVENHVYDDFTYDADSHRATCTVCGYYLNEGHTLKYTDYGTYGHTETCTLCQYQSELLSHTYVKTPTYQYVEGDGEDGDEGDEVEYVYTLGHVSMCACGNTKDDFEAHKLPEDGTYSSYDDEYHYRDCSECSYQEAEPHDAEVTTYINATYLQNDENPYYGYVTVYYVCQACHYQYARTYDLDEETYIVYFGE